MRSTASRNGSTQVKKVGREQYIQDVMSLEVKTIVVTGAAQGIGQAIATLAIGLGARVVGGDINGDKLGAFAATMSDQLLSYVGSVTDPVKPVCFLLSDAASYITGQHIAV